MKLQPIHQLLLSTGKSLLARGVEPELPISSLPDLNKKMWGIPKKRLTIVGGRPSNGKSALIKQICFDIALHKKVFFLSLEDTEEAIVESLFCNQMGIDNLELLRGNFKRYGEQWDQFAEICKTRKLVIKEGMGRNWTEIEKMVKDFGAPDMIVLDYIQMVKADGKSKMDAIEEFVKEFRALAVAKDFAAVLVSQVNREGAKDGKLPSLSGMKGAGALEEHADLAILCHYPHHGDHSMDMNDFTAIIAKNKRGRTGLVDLKFEPQYYRFKDRQEELKKGLPENIRKLQHEFGGTIQRR